MVKQTKGEGCPWAILVCKQTPFFESYTPNSTHVEGIGYGSFHENWVPKCDMGLILTNNLKVYFE